MKISSLAPTCILLAAILAVGCDDSTTTPTPTPTPTPDYRIMRNEANHQEWLHDYETKHAVWPVVTKGQNDAGFEAEKMNRLHRDTENRMGANAAAAGEPWRDR